MTSEELIAFEKDIADCFNRGEIRAPVHLAGGNERQLIDIFAGIKPQDWIAVSWRSHYHCLLKGVPPGRLKASILAGRSISLCFPDFRIISSAIVGGALPIALGVAWSIKRQGGQERVWAFVGDMTAESGMFSECVQYAHGHDLPIRFVVEDNGLSVCTDTWKVWGNKADWERVIGRDYPIQYYKYELPWPHAGAGKRVQF